MAGCPSSHIPARIREETLEYVRREEEATDKAGRSKGCGLTMHSLNTIFSPTYTEPTKIREEMLESGKPLQR